MQDREEFKVLQINERIENKEILDATNGLSRTPWTKFMKKRLKHF